MSPDEEQMEAAFELISEFKEGRMQPGSEMTEHQVGLLKLLRADLVPSEPELEADLNSLVLRLAQADTEWNRKTMETINAIYSLRSARKDEEATSLKQAFLRTCPSSWYKEIVDQSD